MKKKPQKLRLLIALYSAENMVMTIKTFKHFIDSLLSFIQFKGLIVQKHPGYQKAVSFMSGRLYVVALTGSQSH